MHFFWPVMIYIAYLFLVTLKGNCHELRMHLSKFVCDNMPGFLATFRSRNLLFCLQLCLSPPKARHMRAVLPCIDAALNQTWKVQAVFFKLTARDSFHLVCASSLLLLNEILISTVPKFFFSYIAWPHATFELGLTVNGTTFNFTHDSVWKWCTCLTGKSLA